MTVGLTVVLCVMIVSAYGMLAFSQWVDHRERIAKIEAESRRSRREAETASVAARGSSSGD